VNRNIIDDEDTNMPSHWGMVDRLSRELGRLRDDARGIDPRATESAVIAEIDAALARAAHALDETIEAPEESDLFVEACDAVAQVRERICALELTRRHSRALISHGARLRADAMRIKAMLEREARDDGRFSR
jgi:hypothetical protein